MYSRRVLLRPDYARVFAEARNDLVESMCEIASLRAELDRLREEIRELRDITTDVVTGLRQEADENVTALRAKLQGVLHRLARRDVGLPLH